jgi:predicted nucleic acid-binding protein
MYLLDTNVLSELIKKRPHPRVITQIRRTAPSMLFTSVVTVAELRSGAAARDDFEPFWSKVVVEILSRVKILHLDERAAVIAGDLLALLRRRGRPIGLADVLIGAIALAHGCAVVTGNRQHFARIPGLDVVCWHGPERQ